MTPQDKQELLVEGGTPSSDFSNKGSEALGERGANGETAWGGRAVDGGTALGGRAVDGGTALGVDCVLNVGGRGLVGVYAKGTVSVVGRAFRVETAIVLEKLENPKIHKLYIEIVNKSSGATLVHFLLKKIDTPYMSFFKLKTVFFGKTPLHF